MQNKAELAFFLASKLTSKILKKETEVEIEKYIKDFVCDLIIEDKKGVNYDDFELLLKDLERTKNYNEFIILNPYFAKNHNFKYCELIKKLKEFILIEKSKYIVETLNILKNTDINLNEIRDYNMENFKIVNLVLYVSFILILF